MQKKRSLKEKFIEHHNCYGKYHKETTEAVFIVVLLIVGFFAFLQSMHLMTGFVVASGEKVAQTASATVSTVHAINQSGDRMYFKFYMDILWIMLFGLIGIVVVEQRRKKGKL